MLRIWGNPIVEVLLWLGVAVLLTAVAVYFIVKLRQEALQPELSSDELLTNFHELHSQGELSDEEYRTIKAVLAERLQRELKDTGQLG